ncbi:MAG: VOC family protein [Rhodospirillaceae bacterium]|jgi:catechol 2,3-dioxygenase-like lactoylglutathione lyase family enzyme|nr:VOC family protein [Rhodospirillaceae bacterium]MBT5812726.1 VOC family protein [Rhodospirillaceae bacterium]
MTATALTQGAHHIGLTVLDLSQTRSFFVDSLGFNQVGEVADYPAAFLSDGTTIITLWQAENPETAIPFDRKNVVGLHHFALKVENDEVLDKLYWSLSETDGVEIEFAPESLRGGATRHMMIEIPGGIRMELIAPAA